MQGIVNGLSTAAPKILQKIAVLLIKQGLHMTTSPIPLQAPSSLHGNPPMHH